MALSLSLCGGALVHLASCRIGGADGSVVASAGGSVAAGLLVDEIGSESALVVTEPATVDGADAGGVVAVWAAGTLPHPARVSTAAVSTARPSTFASKRADRDCCLWSFCCMETPEWRARNRGPGTAQHDDSSREPHP